MIESTARLLKLLSLLQVRHEWTGPDLAVRLEVSERTVRKDIERLRSLGYPVEANRGPVGGYRLGPGTEMPPLLLDDDETIAIAVSLATATERGISGLEEANQRALAKLQHVLPHRLRERMAALQHVTTSVRPGAEPTTTDATMLQAVASAAKRREHLRIHYTRHDGQHQRRMIEPTRLVNWDARWYLLAWDTDRNDWRTFRVDRIAHADVTGLTFAERDLPATDITAWVSGNVSRAGWTYNVSALIHAPADRVLAVIPSQMGSVEPLDDHTCRLRTGSDDLSWVAIYLGGLDADFMVEEPPELVEHLRKLAERHARAVANST